jgi:hypothetical protein
VIGWYVHHHGHGHLHRAQTVAARLAERGEEVTVLSSLPRPAGWSGAWVHLARDDAGRVVDPTAAGRLHWVPVGDPGLLSRTAAVSAWLADHRPRLVVVDVSVEIALLARLHGVPVVSMVLPGRRGDPAHLLGLGVSDLLVAAWPASARGMLLDVPAPLLERLRAIGGLSRFPVREPAPRPDAPRPGRRRVVVLMGTGGHDLDGPRLASAREQTPDWEWTVLDGSPATWTDDPFAMVADADVVLTHAGQNAVAEVAAARRPAVVVPQQRPHDEQTTTGGVLRRGPWPAVVVDRLPADGWAALLDRAVRLDGRAWAGWCDGGAAARFADLLVAHGGSA